MRERYFSGNLFVSWIRDIFVRYAYQNLTYRLRYLTPQSQHLGSGMADRCFANFDNEIGPAYRSQDNLFRACHGDIYLVPMLFLPLIR